jgi:hypothetical protein
MKSVLCISLLALFVFLPISVFSEIIFEDDFMGDNVDGLDALNWQFFLDYANIVTGENNNAPEYGPGVLVLGPGSTHPGLENDAVKELSDYRVTVLWTDVEIANPEDGRDADFHIGIRCAEYDPEVVFPGNCYEVEFDGDDNDSSNAVPEDGPTHFFIFIRGGDSTLRDDTNQFGAHATSDVVPRPTRNVWNWTSIEAVGTTVRAKTWRYGNPEPDWMLEAEDPINEFPSGGVRLGVWSGTAHVAYVKVETVENVPTDVNSWSLY